MTATRARAPPARRAVTRLLRREVTPHRLRIRIERDWKEEDRRDPGNGEGANC